MYYPSISPSSKELTSSPSSTIEFFILNFAVSHVICKTFSNSDPYPTTITLISVVPFDEMATEVYFSPYAHYTYLTPIWFLISMYY